LPFYTRFTQFSFCTGSGFAELDKAIFDIRRSFDNRPDDFALW
jgi:hypothetical protein